jgi:bifunctional non-homologous end joining protein LigD
MARSRPVASPYKPQLATLVKQPPAGDGWAHELKYDGYRIGALVEDRTVRLISRNGHDWTSEFPQIVAGLRGLGLTKDTLLDGEVCAVLPDGRTSFNAMQNFKGGAATIVYYVFDALRLDGASVTTLGFEQRKAALAAHVPTEGRVQYVDYVVGDGDDVLAAARQLQLEGIVSKKRDALYVAGRSTAWLKTKCTRRQEFVIGGWAEPGGAGRLHLGALLLGYYHDGDFVYAGKVGTGFDAATAKDLRARLERLASKANPFMANGPDAALERTAHWVRPELVVEVAFAEMNPDGQLRHPSFQGLRTDKPARHVTRDPEV